MEFGAGNGSTLLLLKHKGFAKEIHGVDIFDLEQSKNREFSSFVIADCEKHIDSLLEKQSKYDLIILADVLEHLVDPWGFLEKCGNILQNHGKVLISLPNIRNIKTFHNLLIKKSFQYESSGIFDKTHLRFFCKRNMIEMIENAGLSINFYSSDLETKIKKHTRRLLNKLTLGIFRDFWVQQYFFIASKKLD